MLCNFLSFSLLFFILLFSLLTFIYLYTFSLINTLRIFIGFLMTAFVYFTYLLLGVNASTCFFIFQLRNNNNNNKLHIFAVRPAAMYYKYIVTVIVINIISTATPPFFKGKVISFKLLFIKSLLKKKKDCQRNRYK